MILVPAYYRCPMLCTLVTNGVVEAMASMDLEPGKDYEVVTFSFDPADGPEEAATKKAGAMFSLREKKVGYELEGGATETEAKQAAAELVEQAEASWHFLSSGTGKGRAIGELTDAIGFHAERIPGSNDFAHKAAVVVISPDGTISRYFSGVAYSPRDVKFALIEAGEGKIGSRIDQFLLSCYQYHEEEGRYVVAAKALMTLAGGVTVVGLAGVIAGFFVMERVRRKRFEAEATLREPGS